jgi:hypothetical protein
MRFLVKLAAGIAMIVPCARIGKQCPPLATALAAWPAGAALRQWVLR